jgi:hypothetical protein
MGSPAIRSVLAVALLLAGVGIMVLAWPPLAESLTLTATVTARTQAVIAPIAGRVMQGTPRPPGSTVGSDGTILEIFNDRPDQVPLNTAESAFEAAQLRVRTAGERLEGLRLADVRRREAMMRAGPYTPAESEIAGAGAEVGEAQAAERASLQALLVEREAFRARQKIAVKAPPGAVVHSIVVGNTDVAAGDPIARWIDCNDLLVDVPVFDLWLRRPTVGDKAQAMLDGETRWRDATVIAVHGWADVADTRELAAVARGRDRGAGQVLLKLAARSTDFETCPIGRAALARLR